MKQSNFIIKNIFVLLILVLEINIYAQPLEVVVANTPPDAVINTQPVVINSYLKSTDGTQNNLSVPGYIWTYGCYPTAVAMLLAYYDLNGYDDMLPHVSAGVGECDNCYWDCVGDEGEHPDIASHIWIGGRTTKGHVDDYYIEAGSSAEDPYMTYGWLQHTPKDCIADFTGTSMYSNYVRRSHDNVSWYETHAFDGGSIFPVSKYEPFQGGTDLSKYVDYERGTDWRNVIVGINGLHDYIKSRGYIVGECEFRATDNKIPGGFSYNDLINEIDGGRPVILHYTLRLNDSHVVCAFGYNTSGNKVHIMDTYSTSAKQIAWGEPIEIDGESYPLDAVEKIVLWPPPSTPTCVDCNYPGAPHPPTITSINYDSEEQFVQVNWNPATTGDPADYFAIYRCLEGQAMSDDFLIGHTDRAYYKDYTYNLLPNETYKYVVAGVNSSFEGNNSSPMSVALTPCVHTYLVNEEINSDYTMTCAEINIADLKIKNNSNVIVEGGSIYIIDEIEVEIGSSITIGN